MRNFITTLTILILFLFSSVQVSFAAPMSEWEIGLQNRSGGGYFQGFKTQLGCEQDTGEQCSWAVDACGDGYSNNNTYYASKSSLRAIYNYDPDGGIHAKEMMAGMIMSEFCSFPFG